MNRAVVQVLSAYCWWGMSALFWRQLSDVNAIDQLSWRVVSSLALLFGWWYVRGRHNARHLFTPGALTRRSFLVSGVAAILIAANWGAFLWAVSNEMAVDAALGYFFMPLLSAALGVAVLGEELRRARIAALVLATLGVVWLVVVAGRLPLVSLLLGATFAVYGLIKKQIKWSAADGMLLEVAFVAPIMVGLLTLRSAQGETVVGSGSASTLMLLAAAGLVTIVPLLLFASAAPSVPLVVIGLLQYVNPTLQFLVGWLIFGESMSRNRLIGFVFVWAALAVIVVDELSRARQRDSAHEPVRP